MTSGLKMHWAWDHGTLIAQQVQNTDRSFQEAATVDKQIPEALTLNTPASHP